MFQKTPTFMLNDNATEQVDSINVYNIMFSIEVLYVGSLTMDCQNLEYAIRVYPRM